MSENNDFEMSNSNSMETADLAPIISVHKQTPLTEAIEGIKLSPGVGILDNPLANALVEENVSTNQTSSDLLEIHKKSETDNVQTERNCLKNSTLENMDIAQTNDVNVALVNKSNCDAVIDNQDSDSYRKEIFGTLSKMDSVNDNKITFSNIKIPEADKCISSRSGRAIRTRYPKQIHTDLLIVKPSRGQKRKAEINVEDLYTQDRIGEVKCSPLETISEGVEWECGMTKKRRLCQFNSAAVSYDPIPYSPSRAKVRMQKKKARELGVKVCRGRRVSLEDVKGMLDSISGDEEEEMKEEKIGQEK